MSIPLVSASGQVRDGKLFISDRRRFDSAIRDLPDVEVEIEITRLRATRSVQANRYYWGVVIAAFVELTGYTPEEIHEMCKAKFLPKELAFTTGNGHVVDRFVLGGSTWGLDTAEFYAYVERCRDYAASALALYIPGPDEAGYGAGV